MSALSKPYMYDEAAAFKHVEAIVGADGIYCPHCGNAGKIYTLNGVRSKPSKKNPEGIERHGLKKCAECRKQFTVRVGTIFEESHIFLYKWLQAIYLMTSSKKRISAHQLHRVLEITYKSTWLMTHHIREAMRNDNTVDFGSGSDMKDVYQHYNKQHLHRYAAEFELRYNNCAANGCDDSLRANRVLLGIKSKQFYIGTHQPRKIYAGDASNE